MNKLEEEFLKIFPTGKLNENLSRYSSFKIGGPADFFYKLDDKEKLQSIIKFAKKNKIPYIIIGGGTNILFDDNGFRGLIIKITERNTEIEGETLKASAGTPISQIIKASIEAGLTGLESWTGLPGTVGGAVRGNAGYNGLETADILESALVFDSETEEFKEMKNSELDFHYRHSKIKKTKSIVLEAKFRLKKSRLSPTETEKLIKKSIAFRINKQPQGFTTGSFFKNPSPDKPAGFLIDQAGLKGKKIGNAQISEKHANFFMNTGGASSKDILKLAALAKEEVKKKFNIELEEEVRIITENDQQFAI